MGEKGQIFLTEKFQIINVEGMREKEKSPLEFHTNNYCSQEPLKIGKIMSKNLRRNRNSGFKASPHKYLLILW